MNPGRYSWSHISYMQSPYHVWFIRMGYPELDILEYPDGEKWVFQYYNSPVVPSVTKWQAVLGPLRNIDLTYSMLEKYANMLDITKRAFWDRENSVSKRSEEEFEAVERHREEMVERASQAFLRNPDLMDRIAKNGTYEMELGRIARHVPVHEL